MLISATGTLLLTGDLTDFETLHQIFVAREGRLLGQLAEAMGNRKGDMFDTWMKQQSDLVQATALAYGEREVLEASLRGLDDVSLPSICLQGDYAHCQRLQRSLPMAIVLLSSTPSIMVEGSKKDCRNFLASV